jgi:hypothetical protein
MNLLSVSNSPEEACDVIISTLLSPIRVEYVTHMGLALASEGADEIILSHWSNHNNQIDLDAGVFRTVARPIILAIFFQLYDILSINYAYT